MLRVAEIRDEPGNEAADWALVREYRLTYREHLVQTEALLEGVWQGNSVSFEGPIASSNGSQHVPISVAADIAQILGLSLGDEPIFDVQGVPVSTAVGSLRRVNWQRVQANFFVLFPVGVLEDAPQVFTLLSRVDSRTRSAAL